MNAPSSLAALLVRHASGLRTTAVTVALALVLATACSLGPVGKSTSHDCADKLVQEMATNTTVKGLWGCLDPTLQQTLNAYGVKGDDGAFVNAGRGATPTGLITISYAAEQNGVVIYTAVIRSQDSTKPATTLVVVVWVNSSGKITNLTVATPDL